MVWLVVRLLVVRRLECFVCSRCLSNSRIVVMLMTVNVFSGAEKLTVLVLSVTIVSIVCVVLLWVKLRVVKVSVAVVSIIDSMLT